MLTIKNLNKSYKHHIVFNNINLNIDDGDLVYLKGINGSGKSTLFKLICGIEDYKSGSIQLSDNHRIGALIENPSFIENENLEYNLRFLANLNNRYNENYVIQLCQQFELQYDSKTKLKNYSVGMRQKAGIIQAVMEDQNFILLDEPVRGLDENSIQAFIQLINNLNHKGKTIIIASHERIPDINFKKTLLIQDEKIIISNSNI